VQTIVELTECVAYSNCLLNGRKKTPSSQTRRPIAFAPLGNKIAGFASSRQRSIEMAAGATILVSEVADYEVRRELTRLIKAGQLPASRLNRLDQLATLCTYLPVSTAMWRRAAELWADARAQGFVTAHAAALDADALIAAQAEAVQATVVTNNPIHLGRWVPVRVWP
jgi:predicted nucleic acid-binding protein